MTNHRVSRIAWTLVACTLALAMFFVVLVAVAHGQENAADTPQLIVLALPAIFVPWSIVGGLIASRRPENPIGWLFVLAALGMSISIGAFAYAMYSVAADAHWPGAAWAAWLNGWLWSAAGILGPVLLFLTFPDGHFVSRFWRVCTIAIVLGAIVNFSADALEPGPIEGIGDTVLINPIGVESPLRDAVSSFGNGFGVVVMILAISSLVVRFRRSRGEERIQIKWVVYTATVACIAFLSAFVTDFAAGFILGLIALGATPIAAGIAILRYRLYEIDRIVNRTVVYAAVTALLAGLYFAIVIGLQAAFSGLTRGNDLAIAGSTLAVAALFRPARARIQALVDRRFYRRRYDTAQTLAAFSTRLRDQVDLDRLGHDLGAVVHDTMQPTHVSLWLRPGHEAPALPVTISGRSGSRKDLR